MDEYNYTPSLYTLVDEEGVEQVFEMLDAMEIGDDKYYAMIPYFENPQDLVEANSDLVILKSEYVDGEEMLASIDDDDEFEKIGAIFLERLEELFDDECNGDDDCDCHDHDCDCDCCHHGS